MILERKQVNIHYRKLARTADFPSSTLEQLIRSAMNSMVENVPLKNRYTSRVFAVGNDNYLINTYADNAANGTSLVFGDVIHFTKGHLQALMSVGAGTEAAAAVQQMEAPALNEYVHSQMFWMVKGDHVFLIQSMSLKGEDWEKYLKWLLGTRTTFLPGSPNIVLAAKFDEEAFGGDLSNIKEIIVGGVVGGAPRPSPPPSADVASTERTVVASGAVDAERVGSWAMAKDILSSLVGGEANVATLMNAVPADAELHVSVHIGYKTRKRQVDRTALANLETGLRNLPDSQLSVLAKGATKAVDGTVRLHHGASIKLLKKAVGDREIIGSLLDPVDVLRGMFQAYTVFVADGKITE